MNGKHKIGSGIVPVVLLLVIPVAGWCGTELPIRVEKLTPRVLVLKAGVNPQGPNVTALSTEKGIVVIDTHMAPSITRRMRAEIEEEFGRKDFAYVINTHHHFDHSNGNQVFPEALVVGHVNAPAAFKRFGETLEGFIPGRKRRIERLTGELKLQDPASGQARGIREQIEVETRMIDELASDFILTPPTLTFTDRMNLELGDVLLHLIYLGKSHTDNDIIIHCPDEKLLVTGDALSGFMVRSGEESQVELTLRRLNEIHRARQSIEHIVTGHGRMSMEEMTALRKEVAETWERIRGRTSAAGFLEEKADTLGIEAALAEVRRLKAEKSDAYYFEANQFIDLSARWLQSGKPRPGAEAYRLTVDEFGDHMTRNAYLASWFAGGSDRLLQAGRIEEALIIYRANCEAYPESVQSWAGLASALLKKGDKDSALSAIDRALALDPDNSELRRRREEIKRRG